MLVYGLRLLVALVTFSVGVAFSWLLGSESPADLEKTVAAPVPVLVAVQPSGELPPPPPPRPITVSNTLSAGVLNGKAVSKPLPEYPRAAKAAGVGGTVVVQVVVDEGGHVESADAVSGPALLRGAAEDAALRATFSPTRLSGWPVKVSGVITYNFVLP